nr:MAG TPA: hypothetical protein [Caudoviricetes sp.]
MTFLIQTLIECYQLKATSSKSGKSLQMVAIASIC